MNRYFNDKSNYDKYPVVNVPGMEGECRVGWEAISDCLNKDLSQIDKKVKIVVLECYQGVLDDEVVEALQSFSLLLIGSFRRMLCYHRKG